MAPGGLLGSRALEGAVRVRWPGTTALRALCPLARLTLALGLAFAFAPGASADEAADVAHARTLARSHWFHGVPYAAARALRPAGIRWLAALLDDPREVAHHANAVIALGMSEHPLALEPLQRLARSEPRGELTRDAYRVRMALPYALGHLARVDRRALELLEERLDRDASATWSYGQLRGERLRRQLERSGISALGITGQQAALDAFEARRALAGRAARADEPALRRHIAASRELCERVSREGPARVFERRPR